MCRDVELSVCYTECGDKLDLHLETELLLYCDSDACNQLSGPNFHCDCLFCLSFGVGPICRLTSWLPGFCMHCVDAAGAPGVLAARPAIVPRTIFDSPAAGADGSDWETSSLEAAPPFQPFATEAGS